MLTLEEITHHLKDYNLAEVSRQTGVNYQIICKIVNGGGKHYEPKYRDVKRLSSFLLAKGYTFS
jgi:hypothetical protein